MMTFSRTSYARLDDDDGATGYYWSEWEMLRYVVELGRSSILARNETWWQASDRGAELSVDNWFKSPILRQFHQHAQTYEGKQERLRVGRLPIGDRTIGDRSSELIQNTFKRACYALLDAVWDRFITTRPDNQQYLGLKGRIADVERVVMRLCVDQSYEGTLHDAAINAFAGSEYLDTQTRLAARAALLANSWETACTVIQGRVAERKQAWADLTTAVTDAEIKKIASRE